MRTSSEINRYNTIVLLDISGSQPSPWKPDPANPLNQRRETEVYAHLVECLKGEISTKLFGKTIDFTVVQREPLSGRIADYYGPWSKVDLESKPRILLFLNYSISKNVIEEAFGQDINFAITIPDSAYPFAVEDVRLAISLQKRSGFPKVLASQEIQQEIFRRRDKLGPLMARFLIDSSSHAGPDASSLLDSLLKVSDTTALFRAVLLSHFVEEIAISERAPIDKRINLVRIMAAILQESPNKVKVLQENITQAYFKNTVFNADGHAYFLASQAFPDKRERDKIASLIATHKFKDEQQKQIIEWLRSE